MTPPNNAASDRPQPEDVPLSGTVLAHFEILELIGRGGFGEVYKGRDAALDRMVAIKIIPKALSQDPERRERLRREAQAVSALSHPNICIIHEFGSWEGRFYFAMELVDGSTIRQHIRDGSLSFEDKIRVAMQVASGLAHAHAKGR